MRASAELNRNGVPFVGVRLSQQRINISANRDNSNGIRVDLAKNCAKSADAAGIGQAASALVNDGSVRYNGANLIFDLFDLFVGDRVGVGEIEPKLGSCDFAALLIAVGADMGAQSKVEDLMEKLEAAAAAAAAAGVHVSSYGWRQACAS